MRHRLGAEKARLKGSRQKPGVTWRPQRLEEAGRTFPCSLRWEGSPADALLTDFWLQNRERSISAVHWPQTGCLLQQPQDTHVELHLLFQHFGHSPSHSPRWGLGLSLGKED